MKIVEFQHVKPGKGPAFVRTKLKDIQSGKIIDHTFNSGAKIEFIRVTSRKFQYLYKDGDSFIFMDNNTYDQVQVDKLLMDNSYFYIKEGDNIEISFDGDEIISLLLPAKTVLKVTQTDPGPLRPASALCAGKFFDPLQPQPCRFWRQSNHKSAWCRDVVRAQNP